MKGSVDEALKVPDFSEDPARQAQYKTEITVVSIPRISLRVVTPFELLLRPLHT